MVPSTIEEPKRLSRSRIDGESGRTVASRTRMRETAVIVSLDKGRGQRVTPLWPEPQTHKAHLSKNDYQGSHSIDTYDSPILQIAGSPYVSGNRLDAGSTSLLVRLEGTTHLLNLTPNPEFIATSSSAPISVKRVAELGQNSTDRRRHVDVAMDPHSWGRAAIVDEGGGVWLWWEEKELVKGRQAKVTKLVKLRSSVSDAKDDFFRVAFGVRPDTLLVLSRHSIVEIDTSDQDLRLVVISSEDAPAVGGETVLVYQPSSGRVHGTLTLTFDNGLAALISDPWVLSVPQSGEINSLVGFALSPSKYGKADGAVMLVSTGNDTFSVSKLSMSQDKRFNDESSQSSYPHIDIPSLANGLSATEPAAGTTSSKYAAIPGRWAWLSINDETANPLLDPAELSVYLKDPEDHLDTVATRAELVRIAAYRDPTTTRSHVLRGVNYQESFSASDIASVTLSSHFAFSATNGTLLGDGVGELASTPKRHEEAEPRVPDRSSSATGSRSSWPHRRRTFRRGGWQVEPGRKSPVTLLRGTPSASPYSLTWKRLDTSVIVPGHENSTCSPPGLGTWHRPFAARVEALSALLIAYNFATEARPYGPICAPRPVSTNDPSVSGAPSQVPTQRRGSPTFGWTPSSPTALSDPDTFPQSQIERGAHGARPEAATKALKKKVTKRRHGF
ncbi:hypothetical protein CspHIS471_0603770 [Cutaneotrichosporon sp. HIS471]|nr:hypothetical protein CspHIS471_0603770 [Cutaneotrichosporon sp. HIS471]